MSANVHVVPTEDRWAIECEGHAEEKSEHQTQEAAIHAARSLAVEEHSELLVHDTEGQIRSKWSYGEDPPQIPG